LQNTYTADLSDMKAVCSAVKLYLQQLPKPLISSRMQLNFHCALLLFCCHSCL